MPLVLNMPLKLCTLELSTRQLSQPNAYNLWEFWDQRSPSETTAVQGSPLFKAQQRYLSTASVTLFDASRSVSADVEIKEESACYHIQAAEEHYLASFP